MSRELSKKMIRIIVLGVLASVAMGQMFGGMDISSMMANIDPEMLKDLTPEKIQDALQNLPPQMKTMMESMGISKEQLEDAVKSMPKDMDFSQLADQLKDNTGLNLDNIKDMMKKELGIEGDVTEAIAKMKEDLLKEVKKDLEMDIEDADMSDIVAHLKEKIFDEMKKDGIDLNNPEEVKKNMLEEMKKSYGVEPDMDNEEFKNMIVKNIITDLKNEGFDVDPEQPDESLKKVREIAVEKAKEFGFDLSNGFDMNAISATVKDKLRAMGVPIDEPRKLVPYLMQKMQEYMPLIQNIIAPQVMSVPAMQPVPMGPAPHFGQAPLTLNLEINVDGGDHPTAVGAPATQFSEEEVSELLQDLLHYRTMAKSLIAKNHMLQQRIHALEMRQERPVMSRGPMLAALMKED